MLTVCPECKYRLNPAAKACPNCGATAGRPVRTFAGIALFGVIAAGTVGFDQGFGQGGPSAGTEASVALLQPPSRSVAGDGVPPFGTSDSAPRKPLSPLKAEVLARVGLKDMRWQRDADGRAMLLTAGVANESWFDVKNVEVTCAQYSGQGKKAFSNRRIVDGVVVKAGGQFALVSYHLGPVDPATTGVECHVSDAGLVGIWPRWVADNEPNAPETVKELQRRLASRGLYAGEIDGVVGPKTKAAVEKFEAQQDALHPAPASAHLGGRLALD